MYVYIPPGGSSELAMSSFVCKCVLVIESISSSFFLKMLLIYLEREYKQEKE